MTECGFRISDWSSGVFSSDLHPQRILAAQPFITDDDVLQRVVQRMADMQAARHVRRRVDDGEGFRRGPFRAEQPLLLPMGVPAGFADRKRVEKGKSVS